MAGANGAIKLVPGNSNPRLAEAIAARLRTPPAKAGVRRFASAVVPLDEALVQVALDLSGRPFLVYDVDPVAEWIGTFDPQLCEEFWRAFVIAAGITLHIRSLTGRNGHHVIEASFKGVARSLRDAVRVEGSGVPSTKGSL